MTIKVKWPLLRCAVGAVVAIGGELITGSAFMAGWACLIAVALMTAITWDATGK